MYVKQPSMKNIDSPEFASFLSHLQFSDGSGRTRTTEDNVDQIELQMVFSSFGFSQSILDLKGVLGLKTLLQSGFQLRTENQRFSSEISQPDLHEDCNHRQTH